MPWIVPLILVGFPVLEITTFIVMINSIGFLATLALALGGAMLGVMILRNQSLATAWTMREQLTRGEFPVDGMFDGLCLTFAGLLLVFPGFISDALALFLLVPPLRRMLRLWWGRKTVSGQTHSNTNHSNTNHSGTSRPSTPPPVIEGDYQVLEPDDKR